MSIVDLRENLAKVSVKLPSLLGLTNINQIPKLEKITINVGIGKVRQTKEMVDYIEQTLTKITGQKPLPRSARQAIAGFKVRQGDQVGWQVTLRGRRMWEFANRLVNLTFPRIRYFRGLSFGNLDRQGNLTIGFKDQSAFAETGPEAFDKPFGLAITLTIKRSSPKISQLFLPQLGFPVKTS